MIASRKNIRISSKKANLVAGLVRNKKIQAALDILKFTPKKFAPILAKVIQSASANATNNFKQKEEDLVVDEIVITEGQTMKRHVPVSRGRAHPILKRTTHLTVKVKALEPKTTRKEETKTKTEKKPETKTEQNSKKISKKGTETKTQEQEVKN